MTPRELLKAEQLTFLWLEVNRDAWPNSEKLPTKRIWKDTKDRLSEVKPSQFRLFEEGVLNLYQQLRDDGILDVQCRKSFTGLAVFCIRKTSAVIY